MFVFKIFIVFYYKSDARFLEKGIYINEYSLQILFNNKDF